MSIFRTFFQSTEDCNRCKGSGKIPKTRNRNGETEQCPNCSGKGWKITPAGLAIAIVISIILLFSVNLKAQDFEGFHDETQRGEVSFDIEQSTNGIAILKDGTQLEVTITLEGVYYSTTNNYVREGDVIALASIAMTKMNVKNVIAKQLVDGYLFPYHVELKNIKKLIML
jgi:DnaJ-class molecular chaperone